MFIDIHELKKDRILFVREFRVGVIDYGPDAAQAEPLQAEGLAELVDEEIHLRGHLHTSMEVACARCLEATRQAVDKEFDLYYRPIRTIAREEEVEIDAAELEIGFYEGSGLLLEDALREQVLLELPMKSLCRPDCRGLCPRCGQNRNLGTCACPPAPADDRWAALAQFRK